MEWGEGMKVTVTALDSNGKPLPEYRFDEPWNSTNNRKREGAYFKTFACPSDRDSYASMRTNYVAVVGENTLWPPRGVRDLGKNLASKYPNKILLIELPRSGIHWMAPKDITFEEAVALFSAPNGLKETPHSRGAFCWDPPEGLYYVTAGGQVKSIRSIEDAERFAELLQVTTTSGEQQ
jgi:hypothetical protein